MANAKKFTVPDLTEDEDHSTNTLSAHSRFLAQRRSESSEKNKSEENDSDERKSLKRKLETDEGPFNNNKNGSEECMPNLQNEKQSSFETAFSNLKNSKYFVDPKELISSCKFDAEGKIEFKKTEVNTNNIKKITKNRSCIIVNSQQHGNPILKFIRNVPIQYEDIVPDYIINETTCVIFLSLRYHLLNSNYIHLKLKKLGHQYSLRILLVQVDSNDPHHSIKELTKIALLADCTLLLAWSPEEAGRYLEIYKVFENKPPDLLMERQENSSVTKVVNALTSVTSVNRTDAKTLLSNFKSFKNIVDAHQDALAFCPGIGVQKAKNLHAVFNEPFLKKK